MDQKPFQSSFSSQGKARQCHHGRVLRATGGATDGVNKSAGCASQMRLRERLPRSDLARRDPKAKSKGPAVGVLMIATEVCEYIGGSRILQTPIYNQEIPRNFEKLTCKE